MLGKTSMTFKDSWDFFFFIMLHLSSQPKVSLYARGFVAKIQV